MSDPHCCRARTEPVEQRKGEKEEEEGGREYARLNDRSLAPSEEGLALWLHGPREVREGRLVFGKLGFGKGGGLDQWERGKRVQGNAARS